MNILLTELSPDVSCDTSWGNLFKHQDILSLVILFILMNCMHKKVHGCHSHRILKFPDFSLTNVKFP